MKVEAATIVVRDCWLLGHRSVVLRQEGRTTILFCTLCGTRCYSDAALADHLRGSVHARHAASRSEQSALLPEVSGPPSPLFHATERVVSGVDTKHQQLSAHCKGSDHCKDVSGLGLNVSNVLVKRALDTSRSPKLLTSVTVPLEWAGCGQLSFQAMRGAGRPVGAAWFYWQGKSQPMDVESSPESINQLDYSMIVFPYSDGIGRAGFWEPILSRDENGKIVPSAIQMYSDLKDEPFVSSVCTNADIIVQSNVDSATESKAVSNTAKVRDDGCGSKEQGALSQSKKFRRDWKRRQGRTVERVCFLCYQKMVPGKNVAALLNLKSGKMLCASRNKRGVFHVFHSYCLVDWIAVCEAKAWAAACKSRKKKARKNKKKKSAPEGFGLSCPQLSCAVKDVQSEVFSLFCPECQGTGQLPVDSELEQPRYRLAQIYEWILEVVQARKAWRSDPKLGEKGVMGLLFSPDPRPEGPAMPHGKLHCFSTKGAEFLLFDDPDRISADLLCQGGIISDHSLV